MKLVYSFVVDADPAFAWQGWLLAQSLVESAGAAPSDIHVQVTPEVDVSVREVFAAAGFRVVELARFGDGTYCNKLAELDGIVWGDAESAVLLDTDTIAVDDLGAWFRPDRVMGKVVDAENPPLAVLEAIASAAGLAPIGPFVATDDGHGTTWTGNCNGGLYVVPRRFAADLSAAWKARALALLADIEPLRRVGKEAHVDQVSFLLALCETRLPFEPLPTNVNCFVHFEAERRHLVADRPIALLHYHAVSMNVLGRLDPPAVLPQRIAAAVVAANASIGRHFENRLFWNYRYRHWPERGSGLGSRGETLLYKRDLLAAEGIGSATSVLDVGCGDLEVLSAFEFSDYVGLDTSPEAIARARIHRPRARFFVGLPDHVEPADMVLCLEVLIHQPDRSAYDRLVDYVTRRTGRVLIVSGYDADSEAIRGNGMVFFHEPLERSLAATGRFASIRAIGGHSDVTIYRCETAAAAP